MLQKLRAVEITDAKYGKAESLLQPHPARFLLEKIAQSSKSFRGHPFFPWRVSYCLSCSFQKVMKDRSNLFTREFLDSLLKSRRRHGVERVDATVAIRDIRLGAKTVGLKQLIHAHQVTPQHSKCKRCYLSERPILFRSISSSPFPFRSSTSPCSTTMSSTSVRVMFQPNFYTLLYIATLFCFFDGVGGGKPSHRHRPLRYNNGCHI